MELLKRAMRAFRGGFAVVSHSEKLIEEAAKGNWLCEFLFGQNLWLFDIIRDLGFDVFCKFMFFQTYFLYHLTMFDEESEYQPMDYEASFSDTCMEFILETRGVSQTQSPILYKSHQISSFPAMSGSLPFPPP